MIEDRWQRYLPEVRGWLGVLWGKSAGRVGDLPRSSPRKCVASSASSAMAMCGTIPASAGPTRL